MPQSYESSRDEAMLGVLHTMNFKTGWDLGRYEDSHLNCLRHFVEKKLQKERGIQAEVSFIACSLFHDQFTIFLGSRDMSGVNDSEGKKLEDIVGYHSAYKLWRYDLKHCLVITASNWEEFLNFLTKSS